MLAYNQAGVGRSSSSKWFSRDTGSTDFQAAVKFLQAFDLQLKIVIAG